MSAINFKNFQDLTKFKLPANFRGRSAVHVQVWWIVQATLFRWSPQFAYGYRAAILRLFGAKVGISTVVRPTVKITYPWKVTLGDRVWLGDDVVLYSLGKIEIGSDSVISQRSYVCAGDHDYSELDFPIRARPINIGSQCWVATDSFIAPGVTIGDGAVIGARSGVFANMPPAMICVGSPCAPIQPRKGYSAPEAVRERLSRDVTVVQVVHTEKSSRAPGGMIQEVRGEHVAQADTRII